jgi:hypothetical protein
MDWDRMGQVKTAATTVRVHEQSYAYGTGSSTVLDLLLDLCSTGNSTTYGNFKRTTCF